MTTGPQTHQPDEHKAKPQGAHPVLWAAGAVVLAVVAILVLGEVDTPDGEPIIKNPEALITQILITAGVIGAATLPLLIKTQKDAAEAKQQVSNDHSTNLRVENDERHSHVVSLVVEKFDELTRHFNTQVDGVRSDIRGVRRDIGRNTDRLDESERRQERHGRKLDEHLDYSREVVEELKGEIAELHKINASIEDTVPTRPVVAEEEEQ